MSIQEPYQIRVYHCLALDPIHVGTGGGRLGQVDLTIVREPGTNLPKVPGSSLAGSARAYTAMATERYRRSNPTGGYASCAGKGGAEGAEHCGEMDCPVCVTYGFTIGPQKRSFQGLAQFYDAHILFFPVHTMVGPVWVTTARVLADAGYQLPDGQEVTEHGVRTTPGLVPKPTDKERRWGLNLGWLFLDVVGEDLAADALWTGLALPETPVKERLVLISESLFSLVVNSNLEMRTSVSIDPETGAAEDKALFTYEAMPRGTMLYFPVIYQNPQHYVFPVWVANKGGEGEVNPTPFPSHVDATWVEGHAVAGLRLMEYLGVGGMGTRGFGRLRILNLPPKTREGKQNGPKTGEGHRP